MIHVPTGIRVEGNVPEGDFSPTELKVEKERLRASLWEELEQLVAKELHIPRR